ncbi:MAG: hypothetical protein NC911_06145 [Candidatus Omnitrophica bacterium]|nr:hypothetical protein [Candidatus Omnitrophota bacterium]
MKEQRLMRGLELSYRSNVDFLCIKILEGGKRLVKKLVPGRLFETSI